MSNRALLLSGGSALGAVDQVVMENLVDKYGYDEYRTVAGVSVGALNGILFAQRELEKLRTTWNEVSSTSFFMKFNWNGLNQGLYTLAPLENKLKELVSISKISKHIDYRCGVFDLQSEKYWSVSHKIHEASESLIQTILASCAQPILMAGRICRVTKKLSRYCIDGGIRNIIPDLDDVNTYDAVDVILTSPIDRLSYKPISQVATLEGVFSRFLEAYMDNVILHNLQRLKLYSRNVPITIYAPKQSGSQFDASSKTIKWRLEEVGLEMWKNPIVL